jgi:hypothetical protein
LAPLSGSNYPVASAPRSMSSQSSRLYRRAIVYGSARRPCPFAEALIELDKRDREAAEITPDLVRSFDRGRQQPENQRREGDEHRDNEPYKVDHLAAAMTFRQQRIEHPTERAAAEQHKQDERRFEHVSHWIEGTLRGTGSGEFDLAQQRQRPRIGDGRRHPTQFPPPLHPPPPS